METKMKGKSKRGKAIIGIAMAAIMLASVFAMMAPMGMARDDENVSDTAGGIRDGDVLFIGEHGLHFNTTDVKGTPTMLKKIEDGDVVETITINASNFYIPDGVEENGYNLFNASGDLYTDVTIKEPEITANIFRGLKGASTDSIVGKSIPVGTDITIRITANFGGYIRQATGTDAGKWGKVTIKLDTPGGSEYEYSEKFDASAQEIYIDSTDWPEQLGTTGWDTGTYKVKIEADKDTCNEIDEPSPEYEFTVRSEELSIEAEEDEVGKGEDMILTVNGNPSTYYYFGVTDVSSDSDEWPVIDGGMTDVKNVSDCKLYAWIKTGSDGVADVRVDTTGADERTYTIKVYDIPSDTTSPLRHPEVSGIDDATFAWDTEVDKIADTDDAETDVEVTEAEVTFDMDTKVVIGEELTIKGTINAGGKVDILIEDDYVDAVDDGGDNIDVDENNEFEADWDTEGYMTGSYTIKVYIDYDGDVNPDEVDPDEHDEDGSITVRLIEQGLDAEQPRNVVAEGDDYEIEGTATGVKDVDYVLIGPKGTTSEDIDDVKEGLLIDSISVKDDEFSEDDITMKDGLDTGQWIALVLIPGRDAKYGDYGEEFGAGNLANLFDGDPVSLKGKDQGQIVAIIEDNTLDRAGSDDKIVAFSFKVESGYVDLNPVESVGIGEPLNITGVTNREPETTITISTFSGPMDLLAVITEVEWTTTDEGTFTATIDTEDAVEGTYVLEADDGDGNTDTVTVVIGEAAPEPTPTAEPTATPTATPTAVPTAEPTAEPAAEPTATPEPPGFEAVFAIAGLLSIAYLVLRRRK